MTPIPEFVSGLLAAGKRNAVAGIAAALLLSGGVALAHEQKAVITTVTVNTRTQLLEIVHRFSVHDVEHAVRDLSWEASDILSSVNDQARFARFVASQFSLYGQTQLPLRLVGQELEGRYLWVYQEVEVPEDLDGLQVSSTILRKVWPVHQHLVNVTTGGQLRSLIFTDRVSRLALVPERDAAALDP